MARKRIAPARIIAAAASAQFARYEHLAEPERGLRENAVIKGMNQLLDGIRFDIDNDQIRFPSRTRSGVTHTVIGGSCSCEAHTEQQQPCWHIEAAQMLRAILDSQQSDPPPATPPPRLSIHDQLIADLKASRAQERDLTGRTRALTCGQVRRASTAQLRIWLTESQRKVKQAKAQRAQQEIDELFPAA